MKKERPFCLRCGKRLEGRADKLYCSAKCRWVAWDKRYPRKRK